ncbi:MAG: hypothetical protein JWO19_2821 [Bryobacterales bacterium]|jgi:hypothetical protein|nr:hypothetical protein [Bryobacterales bacterium]
MPVAISRSIAGVCVGVDRTGVLHALHAATKSAGQFHEWLLTQRELGVEVEAKLLTNAAGASVTYRHIADAVRELADTGAYDVLFLYFSGHGIVQGGYDSPRRSVTVRLAVYALSQLGIGDRSSSTRVLRQENARRITSSGLKQRLKGAPWRDSGARRQRLVNHKFGELQNVGLGLIGEALGDGQFGDTVDH